MTEAGKRIVTEAYQVLSQVDHLTKVAAQAGQGEIGHLSVGMPSGLNDVLTETLKLFARRYPPLFISSFET